MNGVTDEKKHKCVTLAICIIMEMLRICYQTVSSSSLNDKGANIHPKPIELHYRFSSNKLDNTAQWC